jgi:hypothetical protein
MKVKKISSFMLASSLIALATALWTMQTVQARPCQDARMRQIPCPSTRTPKPPPSTATFTPVISATLTPVFTATLKPVGAATFTATAVPSATPTVQALILPNLNPDPHHIAAVAVPPWPWNYTPFGNESFTPLVAVGLAAALGLLLIIGLLLRSRRAGKSPQSDPEGLIHYPADELDVFPHGQDEGQFGGNVFGGDSQPPNAGNPDASQQGRIKKK